MLFVAAAAAAVARGLNVIPYLFGGVIVVVVNGY
jgi:hypothetical protein